MYVSGRSTQSRVDFNRRVDLVKLRFKRGIKYKKIPEINTSEEIFKLNGQMKSKSCNFYVNGKLRTREIYQDQNYRILICKSKLIDLESQHLTSDER